MLYMVCEVSSRACSTGTGCQCRPKSRGCRACPSATAAVSEITLRIRDGPFLVLYQFPGEALSETRNATVHGYLCTALARTARGYRLYWGVYVIPVSWLTRPYLIAIEPFRRILYPAMLRRIRRAWRAAYGTTA